MNKYLGLLALILCFFLAGRVSYSQNDIYYKRFTTADDLPSSVLYRVYSDSRGFIWISGNTGITRFDGRHFINYGIAEGLMDNEVFDISEDNQGNIWFTTLIGIPGYITPGGDVKSFAPPGFQKLSINALIHDQKNRLWVADRKNHIYTFYGDSLVKEYTLGPDMKVSNFVVDNSGKVWFFTNNTSEVYYIENEKVKSFRLFDHDKMYSTSHRPILLKNGNILVYGYDHLEVINPESKKVVYENILENSAPIICVYEGKDSRLWVGTTSGIDVYVPDRTGEYHLSKINLLKGEKITSIAQDFEGHYWISTINKGLIFIHGYPVLYYKFLDDQHSNTLSLTASGDYIYAGTDDGNIYTIRNGTPQNIFTHTDPFKISRIMSMVTLPNGNVWCGRDNGIIVIRGEQIIHELAIGTIKKMVVDNKGYVWIGTSSFIFKVNAETYTIEKKFESGRVSAMLYDEGMLYYANENGLHSIKNDVISLVFDAALFGNARISDMGVDEKRSIIWIGTFGRGVFGIKNHNIEFHIDKSKGISSDFIYSIECTKNGTLYLGLNKGINRLKAGRNGSIDIWTIDHQNGLIADEVNDIMHFKGYLWASTIEGVCAIGENEERKNISFPKIYLNSIYVNGTKKELKKDLVLDYNENNIEVDITGIAFQSGTALKYKYKLEGLDTNYSYSTTGIIRYNSLPAGEYTFVAHSVNHQNLESDEAVKITFTIYSAYWQTLWFQLFLGVILFVIFLCGILVRIRMIKKKEEEKTRLNKMLGELELTALKAQMNPHFIFNSLGSIQNLINRDKKTEANIYLSKFAKLLRLTLDNSDKKEIALADEINMLELYLGLEGLRFNNQFEYKIEMSDNVDIYEIKIPTMILQPFCENAIKHGLLPKKADASLFLHFEVENEDTLHCTVRDNGIGRVQREKLKENSVAGHVSKGIKITRNRLELVNQLRNKPAEIRITDLYDEEGKAAGTKVDILIPFEN